MLTYATPYGPGHPFSRADLRWIEHVERASGGSLRIRPVWSGGLLSSEMSMEELRHGVADIGLITPIYVRGGTHLIRMQSGFYSGADSIEAQVALYRCLERSTPLWFYILKEAEVLEGGTRLEPVGSRIIGEVFISLLKADKTSFLAAEPNWRPTLPSATPGQFRVTDLLTFAGVVPPLE